MERQFYFQINPGSIFIVLGLDGVYMKTEEEGLGVCLETGAVLDFHPLDNVVLCGEKVLLYG